MELGLRNSPHTFNELFQKDEKIIRNLFDEFNSHGTHFRISEIAKITESDNNKALSYVSALSIAVHFYLQHKIDFDNGIKDQSLKDIKEKMMMFMSSLNDVGKKGLNIRCMALLQYQNEDNRITKTSDELILKMIYDEQHNIIGQFPLVKFFIEKEDHQGNKSHESYMIPVHVLKSLSKHFMMAYEENIMHVKQYNKIGDNVIYFDND